MKPGGQRTKGRAFEQKIARLIRARWAGADVHRSSQADRARDADVVIKGGPTMAARLWLELNDARHPDPGKKLAQAERDIAREEALRLPVVVWHRLGERSIQATTRLWVLGMLMGHAAPHLAVVTMPLDSFLGLVERAS